MPITNIDRHRPGFYIFPINNNRTAWRPFGLPAILVVPHKRDPLGAIIPSSMVFSTKIYIEDVPKSAFVAGHDHVGLRSPDRELYSANVSDSDLDNRKISVENTTITRNGQIIAIGEAKTGDLINYTTSTGISDTIEYIIGADYYDLSDIKIETEILPSGNYNIIYESQYLTRIISKDSKEQFLCIDQNTTSLSLYRFSIQHPGQIIDEFYRLTPPPYLNNAYKSQDAVVGLYRPFTDILQDVADEQLLLKKINWIYDTPAAAIPYLSALLGWELPYFPRSLDQLRKAVLRRTVELQNLKGSKKAIINIFKLFGFEILISNLWWSIDKKRLIRPGEKLPDGYKDQEIQINKKYQVDLGLSDQIIESFNKYEIPLLHRPQIEAGLNDFTALQDGGNITIDAYNVTDGSDAHITLQAIAQSVLNDEYDNNEFITSEFIEPEFIYNAISGAELRGYSQILISGKYGDDISETLIGEHPPLVKSNITLNRESNLIQFNANGYFNPEDQERIFVFITYQRLEINVPDNLKNSQSNRFDLQVISNSSQEFADPTTLEFAIEFLNRLKAFHSLLNVIRTSIEISETYQVTDMSVGGDYEQRYDTDFGKVQVPPAIIPNIPEETDNCSRLDPKSLGYKESDILYRLRNLSSLPEEHAVWQELDSRAEEVQSSLLKLAIHTSNRSQCKFNLYGQDRITTDITNEIKEQEYSPSPNANQTISAELNSVPLSPVTSVISGSFLGTGTEPTTNNNSNKFGRFNKECSETPTPKCELDGVNDYKYKGRVNDETLHRHAAIFEESYSMKPCGIMLGNGVYWAYPTISIITIPGTANPANRSKSQKIRFSGGSTKSEEYYSQGIQDQYLKNGNKSLLGRLYKAYTPQSETIHYTNRPYDMDNNQQHQLAIQRPDINIVLSTMHLPGCRFPTMNCLKNDFEHPTWRARPWDYSFCANNICGQTENNFLNYSIVTNTNGDESLTFDDLPYSISGNNLDPDITSLGDHSIETGYKFDEDDVIHKVYMNSTSGHPAITFEQVCEYDENVTDGRISIIDPIFDSAGQCHSSTDYSDFADGYPCVYGAQEFAGEDIGRSGMYDDVMIGLGLEISSSISEYLFTLGSGILVGKGIRLDCGRLSSDCGDGVIEADYDIGCDSVNIVANLVCSERATVGSAYLNGVIATMLETA